MSRSIRKSKAYEGLELTIQEYDALMNRVRQNELSADDLKTLDAVGKSYIYLLHQIRNKRTRMRDLRALFDAKKTEKTADVLKRAGLESEASSTDAAETEPASTDAGSQAGDDGDGEPPLSSATPSSNDETPEIDKPKPKRKGHGRIGASAYIGAEQIHCNHATLKPGDPCPICEEGKVYQLKEPKSLVRVTGQAPMKAEVCNCQRLRCNLCGEVFTASAPDGFDGPKYDPSCAVAIALLKYGTGVPFHRLERLQSSVGVPVPAGTQWDILKPLVATGKLVHSELIQEAAQGTILHNDDTSARVRELAEEIAEEAKRLALSKNKSEASKQRTGVFTTGIVSEVNGRRIAVFVTGRKHAGENLAEVLRHRAPELASPIQMCDGLDRNIPKNFAVVLGNCVVHGRRNFVNIIDNFPQECRYVLEALRKVFKVDADAKRDGLTPEERLALHQEHSKPVMDGLHSWMSAQLDDNHVEPNSGLGAAINYMLKRWDPLTLFLRKAGAPLHNNICERALKKVVLHRKNALFYKTSNGAEAGDVFMSLIVTCELSGINPFDYLTQLMNHPDAVARNPRDWLPWTYRDAVQNIREA